jgi:hypothetical protein
VPPYQPAGTGHKPEGTRRKGTPFRTQHIRPVETTPRAGRRQLNQPVKR